MEERSLLEGKRCEYVELNGVKYTAYELSAKKAAKVVSYTKNLLSYAWVESQKEENQVKEFVEFLLDLIPDLVIEFIDQIAYAVSESVVKDDEKYLTMHEAENLSLGDLTTLAMGFLEANAPQFNQLIELEIKKKLSSLFPKFGERMARYLKVEEETSPAIPEEKPKEVKENQKIESTPETPMSSMES